LAGGVAGSVAASAAAFTFGFSGGFRLPANSIVPVLPPKSNSLVPAIELPRGLPR